VLDLVARLVEQPERQRGDVARDGVDGLEDPDDPFVALGDRPLDLPVRGRLLSPYWATNADRYWPTIALLSGSRLLDVRRGVLSQPRCSPAGGQEARHVASPYQS
jgi:hypothetical protein